MEEEGSLRGFEGSSLSFPRFFPSISLYLYFILVYSSSDCVRENYSVKYFFFFFIASSFLFLLAVIKYVISNFSIDSR